MTLRGSWLISAALFFATAAFAQEEEGPDLAFLEYLGSWQESDEEWLMVAEELMASADDAEDAPEAGESDDPAEARRNDAEQENED